MLNILTKTIGVDYEVLTSSGGAEALQLIENSEPATSAAYKSWHWVSQTN